MKLWNIENIGLKVARAHLWKKYCNNVWAEETSVEVQAVGYYVVKLYKVSIHRSGDELTI